MEFEVRPMRIYDAPALLSAVRMQRALFIRAFVLRGADGWLV
jgi:hypothetical protein